MRLRRRGLFAVAILLVAGLAVAASGGLRRKKRVLPEGPEPASATCLASAWPKVQSRVALEPVFDPLRFDRATALYQDPVDPARWYLLERAGRVLTFRQGDDVATEWLDMREYGLRSEENESGLLALAFHPQYARNGRVFVAWTSHGDVRLELRLGEIHGTLDGSGGLGPVRDVIKPIRQWFKSHMLNDLRFGPDGYLYVAIGDGRTPDDLFQNGQDTFSLQGKILRIDVDSPRAPGKGYAIPRDNPFADGRWGAPEVFAYGFRNVWRMSFDAVTGELWAGDVGQALWEELNVVVKGGNYGWTRKQGSHCYKAPKPCDDPPLIDPVAEHSHDEALAIVAGFVYRGRALPELWGKMIYADHGTGRVWAVRKGETPEVLVSAGPAVSSFAQDLDGELYLVGYGEQRYVKGVSQGGRIYKLVPAKDEGAGSAPLSLSRTGCVNPEKPTEVAGSLVPYEVNAPLWSDGADKRRWLSLPPNSTISIGDDGDWDLPIGSVVVKEFSLAGRRIETRLLVRHEDGEWSGFTYEWDAEEKDATLVPDGKRVQAGEQTWTIPSRGDCLECHTSAAGRTLGLTTAQLNRNFAKGAGPRGNQLDYLRKRKVFDKDPGRARSLPADAPPDSDEPIEARARAYLASNCSHCHRPGGTSQAEMDLRAETPLAGMNVCNVDPTQGDLGIEGAKLVMPGSPNASLLAVRPSLPGEGRMPPLATSVVDVQGLALIAGWIDSLTSCTTD